MIISLLNQKGGVGKTTLAVHLAMGLSMRRKRVMLVDADPQTSALDWAASRETDARFPVIGLPKATLHREVPKHAESYDYIVIDGPGKAYDVPRSAALASDLILIPVQPSAYDVWASEEIIKIIDDVKNFKDNLKAVFVISRKIVNTAIGRDVTEALSGYPLPVLKTHICQRVGFAESAGTGLTVMETEPESLASQEIQALTKEVMELLKR